MQVRRSGRWAVALLVALVSMGATASIAHAMERQAVITGSKVYSIGGQPIAEVHDAGVTCSRDTYSQPWSCNGWAWVRDRASDGYCALVRVVVEDVYQARQLDKYITECNGVWKYTNWSFSISVDETPYKLWRWVGRSNGTQGLWGSPDYFI